MHCMYVIVVNSVNKIPITKYKPSNSHNLLQQNQVVKKLQTADSNVFVERVKDKLEEVA